MKRFAILALLIPCVAFAQTAPPVAIKHVNPLVSDMAKRAGISGIVIVELMIDHNGAVKGGRIVKPLPYGLDQSALDAVKQWTFRPATLNGQPVGVLFNITVSFRT